MKVRTDITPYHNMGHTCKYYELEQFQNDLNSTAKLISFLSQNIHNLPGKWSEFGPLISDLNSYLSALHLRAS